MPFITSWRVKDRQNFYAPLLTGSPCCFDIGANNGEYTAAFLSLGARQIVAVEPQVDQVRFIEAAFPEDVQSGRVIARAAALGAEHGKANLFTGPDSARSMSSLSTVFIETSRANGQNWDRTPTEVEVITLDSLIEEFGVPDYAKIDVEGFDLEVLRGLSQPIDLISFEFNTQPGLIEIAAQCIGQLLKLDQYEFNYQVEAGGETAMQFARWVEPRVMQYTLLYDLVRRKSFGDIFARRLR